MKFNKLEGTAFDIISLINRGYKTTEQEKKYFVNKVCEEWITDSILDGIHTQFAYVFNGNKTGGYGIWYKYNKATGEYIFESEPIKFKTRKIELPQRFMMPKEYKRVFTDMNGNTVATLF